MSRVGEDESRVKVNQTDTEQPLFRLLLQLPHIITSNAVKLVWEPAEPEATRYKHSAAGEVLQKALDSRR